MKINIRQPVMSQNISAVKFVKLRLAISVFGATLIVSLVLLLRNSAKTVEYYKTR